MPTIASVPRRTIIVVDECNGCVKVSVCIRREKDSEPITLLDNELANSQEELFEIIRDKFGLNDAQINAL